MWEKIDTRISRALSRIRLAFRGVIRAVNSGTPIQLVQGDGMAGETLQDAELFQHYGFTSVPLPGAMKIVLPIGGRTSHGIVIATEHASYRLQGLAGGEVALYTDEGAKIVLKRGKIIETSCEVFRVNCQTWEVNAQQKADFNTPTLTASTQLIAQGQITGNGGMAVSGGQGASFSGNVSQTGGDFTSAGDVIASGTHLHGHRHQVNGLGALSDPPTD